MEEKNNNCTEFVSQQGNLDINNPIIKILLKIKPKKRHFGFLKNILKIKRLILGSKIDEIHWSNKYLNKEKEIIDEYKSNNHRLYLLDKIKEIPFDSAIEIGTNWGPNLQMIMKYLPDKDLTGIDISNECINIGNKLFIEDGYNNIKLIYGNINDYNFEKKKYDLTFSWACLIYIDSNKIESVIDKIMSITNKRILLAEFHDESINKTKWDNNWIHNYKRLFSKYDHKIVNIQITKIKEMNNSSIWQKYGYFIDVLLK